MQINQAANFPPIIFFFVFVNTLQYGGNNKTRMPLFLT